jgi:hypothetical protein
MSNVFQYVSIISINIKLMFKFFQTFELEFPSPQAISEQPAWQGEKKVVPEGEWQTGAYLRDPGHRQFALQSTSKPSLQQNSAPFFSHRHSLLRFFNVRAIRLGSSLELKSLTPNENKQQEAKTVEKRLHSSQPLSWRQA